MPRTETLVLLPGLMCDESVWSLMYPHLPETVPIQVMDYEMASSIPAMAQRVLELAPAHFALAGHSMGGRVAMEVTRRAPERVTRLALLDTGHLARPTGEAGDLEAAKRLGLLQVARTQGVAVMARTWVQGMVLPERLHDARFIASIVEMFARKSADVFACQIQALLDRPDASEVLRNLSVPTLLLCGDQDAWSPPEQHQKMHELARQAVLEYAPEAGHMSPMERPEFVAHCFTRWLTMNTRV